MVSAAFSCLDIFDFHVIESGCYLVRTGCIVGGKDIAVLFRTDTFQFVAEGRTRCMGFPAFVIGFLVSKGNTQSSEFVGTADTPDGGIVGIGRPAEVGQQKQRAVIIIQAQCIAVIIGTVLFQGIAVRISGFLVRVGAECIGCIEIKAIEDR